MPEPGPRPDLSDPVTSRMNGDFRPLAARQTVGEALALLRDDPPPARVLYLYVVDDEGRLAGVVPTRRLLLSLPATPLHEIMVREVITLPAAATVLEACEFFIQHRLLAFPVVDGGGRMVGVVDVDLYTDAITRLSGEGPIRRLLEPVLEFLRVESAGGIVLMAATAVALLLANSRWAAGYAAFWQTEAGFALGGFRLVETLHDWVNDGLMPLFFFVVGLEIKREIVSGELNDRRKALLPVLAAAGGMVVPALLYSLVLMGRPGSVGWGIPMATDIAFVVGFLALLGNRVPHGLKVFLLSLAIADDVGATLVIAVAYSHDLSLPVLGAGVAGLAVVGLAVYAGVRMRMIYALLSALIWLAFHKAGVHPTVAGVCLGLLTPARPMRGARIRLDAVTDLMARVGLVAGESAPARNEPAAPLDRLQHALHPWVAFIIMPVFALANAGVVIEPRAAAGAIAAGVILGLVVGKPLGIVLFSWAALQTRLARMPEGVDLCVLSGAGCLGGIGFTMSLFIALLALSGLPLEEAKIGILAGSTVSATVGCVLLLRFLPKRRG